MLCLGVALTPKGRFVLDPFIGFGTDVQYPGYSPSACCSSNNHEPCIPIDRPYLWPLRERYQRDPSPSRPYRWPLAAETLGRGLVLLFPSPLDWWPGIEMPYGDILESLKAMICRDA